MKEARNIRVGSLSFPVVIVEKPAVLGVMDWKKDESIFSFIGRDLRVNGFFDSKRKNKKAPRTIRKIVVLNTTLA